MGVYGERVAISYQLHQPRVPLLLDLTSGWSVHTIPDAQSSQPQYLPLHRSGEPSHKIQYRKSTSEESTRAQRIRRMLDMDSLCMICLETLPTDKRCDACLRGACEGCVKTFLTSRIHQVNNLTICPVLSVWFYISRTSVFPQQRGV